MSYLVEKVTERTFYPILIEVIKRYGGAGISEVSYNSEPDIVFELLEVRDRIKKDHTTNFAFDIIGFNFQSFSSILIPKKKCGIVCFA